MKVSNKVSNSISNSIPHTGPGKGASESANADRSEGVEGLLDTKAARSPRGDVSDSAKVDVSSRAQDMRRAKELATPSDSIDEAKVARLQKMIDDGNYKVDAGAIADRMLDEHAKMPL